MTYQLIETKTLGTAAAEIQFTSIPQDATDLLVFVSLRTTGDTNELRVRINGDTGFNYTDRRLFGDGSTATSNSVNQAFFRTWGVNPTSYTANTFSNGQFYFPNYTGSTQKSISLDSVTENNATGAVQNISAGIWTGTAAISSLLFYPFEGNLVAGSTISLYKITRGTSNGVVVS